MKRLLALFVPIAVLTGCGQSDSSLSKTDDQTLRNNLSRELTAEEKAKMGGGPGANAGAPALPPEKKAGP